MKQPWDELIKPLIAGVVVISGMVILGIIALRLDGEVAGGIVTTINQVVLLGMGILGAMRLVDGAVSVVSNRAQAQIAIAQAQAHAQVASASIQAGTGEVVPPPLTVPSSPLITPTPAPVSTTPPVAPAAPVPPVVGL